MSERIITSLACIEEGMGELGARFPEMARAYGIVGALPLRRKPEGFARLFQAIVGQQVSVASARAIWARIEEAGLVTERAVSGAGEDSLRAVGLSRQKIRYAQALALAEIDYGALAGLSSVEVIKTLTAVAGIGPWTAEIYVMFSLGRADVFAPGDLALQEGARLVMGWPERPSEREMRKLSLDWAPWRAVAARLFWAYYAYDKGREGTT